MTDAITLHTLKKSILAALSTSGGSSVRPAGRAQAHKINLIGREFQQGDLEHRLGIAFHTKLRVLASRAFEELKRDGYIQSTHRDLTDPENWVV